MKRVVLLVVVLTLVGGGRFGAWGKEAVKAPAQVKAAAEKPQPAVLTDADCIKCHPQQVKELASKGHRHRKVGCLGCHKGHAPLFPKSKMIPKCSECHKGQAHFTLKNCLSCHTNPHTPLEITFKKGQYKKACLTCHSGPGEQMAEFPSAHAQKPCNFCHTRHGYIPTCLKCHKPHLKGQTFDDCVGCHQAHKPTQVTYGANIPNRFCGACHGQIEKTLESGKTKHARLACVFCHRGVHGVKPRCQTCHGIPHPQSMLEGFKGCLDCHQDPHNLVK